MKDLYKRANEKANDIALSIKQAPYITNNLDNFLELIYRYFQTVIPYSKEGDLESNHTYTEVSFAETIDYVREYLGTLSPDILEEFDNTIKSGVFRFIDMRDEVEKKKITNECSYQNFEKDEEGSDYHSVIEIHTYGTIEDATDIVHEFFHHLNHPKVNVISEMRLIHTEGVSIFFENDFLLYMADKNNEFLGDVVQKKLGRYQNTLNISAKLLNSLPVLNAYMEYGTIDEETYNKCREDHRIIPDTLGQFDIIVGDFNKTKNVLEIPKELSYVVGTVLASNPGRCPDVKKRFLDINNSLKDLNSRLDPLFYLNAAMDPVEMMQSVVSDIKVLNLYKRETEFQSGHQK